MLWAGRGGLPRFYPDVLEVWRPWAPDLRGEAVDASHFMAEDRPEAVAAALLGFLADPGGAGDGGDRHEPGLAHAETDR